VNQGHKSVHSLSGESLWNKDCSQKQSCSSPHTRKKLSLCYHSQKDCLQHSRLTEAELTSIPDEEEDVSMSTNRNLAKLADQLTTCCCVNFPQDTSIMNWSHLFHSFPYSDFQSAHMGHTMFFILKNTPNFWKCKNRWSRICKNAKYFLTKFFLPWDWVAKRLGWFILVQW